MQMIECMHLSKTYKLKMPNSKGLKQNFPQLLVCRGD